MIFFNLINNRALLKDPIERSDVEKLQKCLEVIFIFLYSS